MAPRGPALAKAAIRQAGQHAGTPAAQAPPAARLPVPEAGLPPELVHSILASRTGTALPLFPVQRDLVAQAAIAGGIGNDIIARMVADARAQGFAPPPQPQVAKAPPGSVGSVGNQDAGAAAGMAAKAQDADAKAPPQGQALVPDTPADAGAAKKAGAGAGTGSGSGAGSAGPIAPPNPAAGPQAVQQAAQQTAAAMPQPAPAQIASPPQPARRTPTPARRVQQLAGPPPIPMATPAYAAIADPIPDATKKIEAAAARTLADVDLPPLIVSPGGHMPSVFQKPLTQSERRAILLGEPAMAAAGLKPEEKQKINDARAMLLAPPALGEDGKPVPVDVPVPQPIQVRPLPPADLTLAQQSLFTAALAQLLAEPGAEARDILDTLKKSSDIFPGGILLSPYLEKDLKPLGEGKLPEIEQALKDAAGPMADAMGVAGKTLDDAVADRRAALETERQQAKMTAEEKAEAARQLVAANASAGATDAATANAVAADARKRAVAARKKPKPTFRETADAAIARIRDKVSEAIARFKLMEIERGTALDEAAAKQIEACLDAVTADQLSAATSAGTAPDKDGKVPAASTDPVQVQRQKERISKAINAAKAWADARKTLLKDEVKRLKAQAAADIKTNIAAVEAEGAAAFRALKTWGDTQDGAVENWWSDSARNLENWADKAQDTAGTWAAVEGKLSRLKMQRDLEAINSSVQEQMAADEKHGEAFAKLPDDARQRFVDGIITGGEGRADVAKGLAGGMRQRLVTSQKEAVEKALDADALALPTAAWKAQEALAQAKDSGFSAAQRSDAIYKAGEDKLGTDESAIYQALTALTPLEAKAVRGHYQETHGHSLEWALGDEMSGDELRRATSLLEGDKGAAAAEAIHDAVWGPGTNEKQIMDALRGLTDDERAKAIAHYKKEYGEDLETRLGGDLSGTDLSQAVDLLHGKSADADAEAIQGGLKDGIFSPDRDSVTAVYDRVRQESLAKAKTEGWTSAELDAEIARRNGAIEKSFGAKFAGDPAYGWGGSQSPLRTAITSAYSFDPANRKLINALADNDLPTADAALMQTEREGVYADDAVLKGVVRKQYDRAFETAQLDRGPELASKVDRGLKDWTQKHYDKDGKLIAPYTEEQRINERMKLQRDSDAALQDEAFDRARGNSVMLDTVLKTNHGISLDDMISQNMSWGDKRQARSELAVMMTPISGDSPEALKTAKQSRRLDWAYSRVRYAIEGVGTDMDELKAGVAGLSKKDLAYIDAKWRDDHGNESFRDAVKGDTSGREEDDLLDTVDNGASQTIAERMADVRRKHDRDEKSVGALGAWGSGAASKRSHAELDEMEALLGDLRNPTLDPRKREFISGEIDRRITHAEAAVEAQRARVDALADMLTTIASYVIGAIAVIIGAIVAVVSGGTALPALIAIAGSILGTLSGMAIKAAVKGGAYGSEEFLTDAVVGAVDLAVTIATAGTVKGGSLLSAAKAELKEIGKASIRVGLKQAARETAEITVKQAAETAAKGSVGKRAIGFAGQQLKSLAKNQAHQFASALPTALVANVMNENNLRHGNMLKNIAHGTLDAAVENLKVGAVMGGAGHLVSAGLGHVVQVSHPPKTPVEVRAAEFKAWKEQNPERHPREFVADFETRQAASAADAALAHAETRAARKAMLEGIPPAERGGFADVPVVRVGEAEFKALNKGQAGDAMLFKKDGQVALVVREGAPPAAIRELTTQLRDAVAPGTAGRTVNPAEALPPRLQNRVPVDVVRDPSLKLDGVRVVPMDPGGKIMGVRLEVGPNARAVDIRKHIETIDAVRKFEGLAGEIRLAAIDTANAIGADIISPTDRGRWEAALEVEKLKGIVDERVLRMAEEGVDPRRAKALAEEVAVLRNQLDSEMARLAQGAAAEARGYIAAEGTKKAGKKPGAAVPEPAAGAVPAKKSAVTEPSRIIEPQRLKSSASPEALAQRARQVEILENFADLDHAEAVARKVLDDLYTPISDTNAAIADRRAAIHATLMELAQNPALPSETRLLIDKLNKSSKRFEIDRAFAAVVDAGAVGNLSGQVGKLKARQLADMHKLVLEKRAINQQVDGLVAALRTIEGERLRLQKEFSGLKGGVFDHVAQSQLGDPQAILCLEADTPVWTSDGLVPIAALMSGDRLAGLTGASGTVAQVLEGHAFAAVDVLLGDGSHLVATRGHPVRVLDPGRWVPARLLYPGLRLAARGGAATIVAVQLARRTIATRNIVVAPGHVYLAGTAGVLVHNGEQDERPSNWASPGRRDAMIYAVVEKAHPDVIIYIGKTYQPTIESRFDQHLQHPEKKEIGWSSKTHEIKLVDFGHWTDYETAIWEEHYIRLNGGIAESGKPSKLINDIHAITDEAIRIYGDPQFKHDPCQ